MHELALFAGAGGGILGGHLCGWRTVCAVEWDAYCQSVLLQRQADGALPYFPVWGDVRTFNGSKWRGAVDVITAGFPCQPFSQAGRQKGDKDERNMWPDTIRIIREVGPQFALLENVPGLLSWDGGRYFGTVLSDLHEAGFDAEWDVIGADEIGAPHRRKRLWILAHATGRTRQRKAPGETGHAAQCGENVAHPELRGRLHGQTEIQPAKTGVDAQCHPCAKGDTVPHPVNPGLEGHAGHGDSEAGRQVPGGSTGAGGVRDTDTFSGDGTGPARDGGGQPTDAGWWDVEPNVGRVANGVAARVDRLKAIGNGQVAAVAAFAWHSLMERVK